MCASYRVRAKRRALEGLGISIPEVFDGDEFDVVVQGYKKTDRAPVVVLEGGRRVLREMCFSLCPRWSREFPFRASTYNARMSRPRTQKGTGEPSRDPKTGQPSMEYIFQMPTWKASFRDRHCLVPISYAMESSYFGTHAGNMVRFSRRDGELLLGVGIWDRWIHRGTGECIDSFALLTDDPYEFFYDTGHDRSFLVISDAHWDTWLEGAFVSPEDAYGFVRENRISPDWKAEIERPMKKGWEKRAPGDDKIRAIGETVWR